MTEEKSEQNDVTENIRRLGDNLVDLLHAAWERPERKKAQADIEKGLDEFGRSVQKVADEFAESDTGRRLKSEVESFRERVDEQGVADTVRSDIEVVLDRLNLQLEKLSEQLRRRDPDEPS